TQSGAYYSIKGLKVGSAKITASANGWAPSTITIDVVAPTFVFNGLQTSRTVNGTANSFTVYAYTPGCGYCDTANADVTVTFSVVSSPAGIETVTPATAKIPANTNVSGTSAYAAPPPGAGTSNTRPTSPRFTHGHSSS